MKEPPPKIVEDDEDLDEILDKDGKPFFGKFDMEKMVDQIISKQGIGDSAELNLPAFEDLINSE